MNVAFILICVLWFSQINRYPSQYWLWIKCPSLYIQTELISLRYLYGSINLNPTLQNNALGILILTYLLNLLHLETRRNEQNECLYFIVQSVTITKYKNQMSDN